ncbi:hypothetical protein JP75_06710 [Devosia riboflavina]|uniref:Uncharacterized protein n=1 Tax=Devosia riboflavina TaxID=46914 RepID=A0A087M4E3_9HYPH|nr:hypothetical protein [Devosia riboflavina]KFL31746.1 hypothetical protein JP75_06710 [Devosia riboflavina]
MKLLPDWRKVLVRAWSMWALAISILLSALEVALPFLQDFLPLRPGAFAVLIFLTVIAAAIARLLVQKDI